MARHFLKDDDVTAAEQAEILELAGELKAAPYSRRPFAGPKTVALIFDKTSTRTRVSFTVGVADLGGNPMTIDTGTSQMGKKESIADTARVLERQVATIVWRTYAHAGLEEMAQYSSVPVINSLSDDYHPCQILADLLTIKEHKGQLKGKKFAYVGDASNNMANSYLIGMALAGMHVAVAGPSQYLPNAAIVARAQEIAAQQGGSVLVTTDAAEAVAGADAVATDTWISMGQEDEKEQRIKDFAGFTVDQALMAKANSDAIFLHCLPAYRGYEVSAEVIDGTQSVIWDEAENRLHAQKALMVWLAERSKKKAAFPRLTSVGPVVCLVLALSSQLTQLSPALANPSPAPVSGSSDIDRIAAKTQRFANTLIGKLPSTAGRSARAHGYFLRITSVDGAPRWVTMDYWATRIELEFVHGRISKASVG